jgi:hypothetical protein
MEVLASGEEFPISGLPAAEPSNGCRRRRRMRGGIECNRPGPCSVLAIHAWRGGLRVDQLTEGGPDYVEPAARWCCPASC